MRSSINPAYRSRRSRLWRPPFSSGRADYTPAFLSTVPDLIRDGTLLHSYMTDLARKSDIFGFTAEVLVDNLQALKLIEKMGFETVEAEGGAKE